MKKVLYMFGPLSDLDVDWMIANGTVDRVAPRARIVEEGGETDAVFILLQGALSVSTKAAGEVNRLEWGEVIGEMSLVDGRSTSATVTAIDASQLLRLPRARLEQHLQRDSGFAARFFQALSITLSERLRATMKQLEKKSGQGGVDEGELSLGLLNDVHLAGARFERLVKAKLKS